MRIISKFHDYYDVLNDGSDTYHVWKRETSSLLPDLNDPFYKTGNWENDLPHLIAEVSVPKMGAVYQQDVLWRGDTDDYRRSLLLFCGEFHPFVRLPERVCWDFESFVQTVELEGRPYCKRSWCFAKKKVFAKVHAMFTQETILPRFRTLNFRLDCPIVLMDMHSR